jgi:hypothetical protein
MATFQQGREELRRRITSLPGDCPGARSSSANGDIPEMRRVTVHNRDLFWSKYLEAAGIEPASERRSARTSTCVFGLLIVAPEAPAVRIPSGPSPKFRRDLGAVTRLAHRNSAPLPPDRRNDRERGYLSSQCQFSVGSWFLPGDLRVLGGSARSPRFTPPVETRRPRIDSEDWCAA